MRDRVRARARRADMVLDLPKYREGLDDLEMLAGVRELCTQNYLHVDGDTSIEGLLTVIGTALEGVNRHGRYFQTLQPFSGLRQSLRLLDSHIPAGDGGRQLAPAQVGVHALPPVP